MASSSSSASTPPPSAAKKNFLRRILPVILVTNVAVGVYVLLMSSKKDTPQNDEGAKVEATPPANANGVVSEKTSPAEASAPIKVLLPIPEHEQRELFKWMLEEEDEV